MPGAWLPLEGKPLRQIRRPTQKVKALPGVRAGAGQTGITWGQGAVDAPSKEITALPELREFLDRRAKLVTPEARGYQKTSAETIVAGGGDYLWAVKDKQPPLPTESQAAFALAAPPPARSPRL